MERLTYSEDHFVLLVVGEPEQFLTAAEMLAYLERWITEHPEVLPPEVVRVAGVTAQAQALLDSTCELVWGPGQSMQWYAVRLEK